MAKEADFINLDMDEPQTPPIASAASRNIHVKTLQRDQLLERLKKVCGDVAAVTNLTEVQLQVKLTMVERYFDTFETLQTQLEELDESQVGTNHRMEFESAYFDAKCTITSRLAVARSITNEADHLSSTRVVPSSSSRTAQLPKLQLSKFSGRHVEWLDFFNMFSALVHNNNDLTSIEKFQYLRSCLTDKAARLIQSLEVTSTNYEKAIELLIARYDNKRLIFQSHLSNIFELLNLTKPNLSSLREFIDVINANLRAMQSLASRSQIADGVILYLITSKLDANTQTKWEDEIAFKWDRNSSSSLQLPSWDDLAEFLERRCQTFHIIEANRTTTQLLAHNQRESSPKTQPQKHQQLSFVAADTSAKCTFCERSPLHNPFACEKFIKLDPYKRYSLVKTLKLCLNCLRQGHNSSNCPSLRRCQHCRVSHHTLLHRTRAIENDSTNNNVGEIQERKPAVLQVHKANTEVVLATALVRLHNVGGSSIIARALLDSGSQLHFVTERIAQHLRLARTKHNIEVTGIGSTTTKMQQLCTVKLHSLHNAFSSTIKAIVIPSITACQPTHRIDISKWNIPHNITLADEDFFQPNAIDCLLGASLFYELLLVGQIKLHHNLPTLQKTKLGWIVSGAVQPSPIQSSSSLLSLSSSSSLHPYKAFIAVSEEPPLDTLMEKFWKLEDHHKYSSPKCSAEQQYCEDYFKATTKKCPKSNKFIVRLPFKESPCSLGQSFDVAYTRLVSLETKMRHNNALKHEYHKFIDEYFTMGHMVLAENDSLVQNFIPHHAVTKLDSSTTKLRVVFDASCHTSNGNSLNNILCVGPTLQDDIFTILIRFRTHKYVLMADIAKMYRQILVDEDDAKWQCILWRDLPQNPVRKFQLQTVTYGTSCAPYLAVKCLRQLAENEAAAFPIGSAVTLRDFYVDNLMTGGSTVEEVVEIKHQVVELLNRGGFPLRKFASNNTTVIADVPQSDREEIVHLNDTDYIKALGLRWSPSHDCLLFAYQPSSSSKPTKRTILSHIFSFFDPLGLINPIIVSCKILMQDLWKLNLQWDESIPQDVFTKWNELQHQFSLIKNIEITRYVPFNTCTEFHAFADASTKAYGACIYMVTRSQDTVNSSLLCAKSRVAPTKQVSLPRLELCATLLLAELLSSVVQTFNPNPKNIHCWSDSTIALCWIQGEPSRWTVFVANRVTKIQQLTATYQWHHVSSGYNPADLVSRGATVKDLIDNSLWFHGPAFLSSPAHQWPTFSAPTATDVPEQRRQCTVMLVRQPIDIFATHKYINNYNKFLRIFTYVRRFAYRRQLNAESASSSSITSEEINATLTMICRVIQQIHFRDEYTKISNHQVIDRSSKLLQLAPFMHNDVIRVGGRLKNSSLEFNSKHPIVLPHSHPFVRTLIAHHHRQNLHAGAQTLQNILRDKFWIIGARNIIRQVIHQCIICYRLRPIIAEQVMGALPTHRSSPSSPFEIAGVDFCGPLLVTQKIRSRAPIKVYIAVFICFSTKAVHLEVVPDLSTPAFIAALKRFFARRGKSRLMYSDNATNFIGANRELRELLHTFITQQHIEAVEEFCRNEGVQWKFIPPRSPHFGGLWESAVKLCKHYIRRSIGTLILSLDELHTVVCQAEAIVNSRPLTPLSNDPDDLRPLTPAHFLVGRTLTTIPEPSSSKITLLKRYQIVRQIQQQFWLRWHREYLTELQRRSKWSTVHPNIKQGDLVLLKDELTAPLKWPMGRVVETKPGNDGNVRVVVVKTANKLCTRAIAKICKLPIETQSFENTV